MNNDSGVSYGIKLLTILLVLVAGLFIGTHISREPEVPYTTVVTVQGAAEKPVWCDQPIIYFTLQESGTDLGKLHDALVVQQEKVLEFLKTFELKDSDIEQTSVNYYPRYRSIPIQPVPRPNGQIVPDMLQEPYYDYSMSYTVKNLTLEQASSVMGFLSENSVARSNVSFEAKDQNKIYLSVLEEAKEDALEKAKALLGNSKITILEINVGWNPYTRAVAADYSTETNSIDAVKSMDLSGRQSTVTAQIEMKVGGG